MTASEAVMAQGLQLKRAGVAIAELTKIGDFELEHDSIDVTHTLSGKFTEQKPGLSSVKDLEIEANLRVDDATGQMQMYADFLSGATSSWTIEAPDGLDFSWSFTAWVKKFKLITPVAESKVAQFAATLAITGTPALDLDESADLTGLSFSDGALSPGLAAGVYNYSNVVTSGSVTVTATKASATLKLFVDGVLIQTLTSGSASSAIAMSAGQSKVVRISTQDAGKVLVWYTVLVTRT